MKTTFKFLLSSFGWLLALGLLAGLPAPGSSTANALVVAALVVAIPTTVYWRRWAIRRTAQLRAEGYMKAHENWKRNQHGGPRPAGRRNWADSGERFEWKHQEAVFAFGRYSGRSLTEVAKIDADYLRWMSEADFPDDTRRLVRDVLEKPQPVAASTQTAGAPPAPPMASQSPSHNPQGHMVPQEEELITGAEAARKQDAAAPNGEGPLVYTYSAPGMPLCPECNARPALFHCIHHRISVCLACISSHDIAGECLYVPPWRGGQDSREKSESADRRPKSPTRKIGGVFGIS